MTDHHYWHDTSSHVTDASSPYTHDTMKQGRSTRSSLFSPTYLRLRYHIHSSAFCFPLSIEHSRLRCNLQYTRGKHHVWRWRAAFVFHYTGRAFLSFSSQRNEPLWALCANLISIDFWRAFWKICTGGMGGMGMARMSCVIGADGRE